MAGPDDPGHPIVGCARGNQRAGSLGWQRASQAAAVAHDEAVVDALVRGDRRDEVGERDRVVDQDRLRRSRGDQAGQAAAEVLLLALERAAGRTDVARPRTEPVMRPGSRYIDFLLPGLIGLNLLGTGMWGIGFAIANWRQQRLLRRMIATPMRRSDFLLALMIARLLWLVLEVGLILGFGALVFGTAVRGSWLSINITSLSVNRVETPAFRQAVYNTALDMSLNGGMTYRKTSHAIYDLKYHVVWITKYRKPVLRGEIGKRLRELIRQTCETLEVYIEKGHIAPDHIHLLISVPPHVSVSDMMQRLKGRSSRKMLEEFGELRKQFWGQHLWARGYLLLPALAMSRTRSSSSTLSRKVKTYLRMTPISGWENFRRVSRARSSHPL